MQKLRYSGYFKTLFIAVDVAVISAVFSGFYLERRLPQALPGEKDFLNLLLLILYWVLLSGRSKLYSIPRNLTYTLYLERLLTHITLFIFGVILLSKASNNPFLQEGRFRIATVLFATLCVVKSLIFIALKYLRAHGYNYRNIMFLHPDTATGLLEDRLARRRDYGFRVHHYPEGQPVTRDLLVAFWELHGIHTLYLPAEEDNGCALNHAEISRLAELHKVRIALVPNIIQNNFLEFGLAYIETQPVLVQAKMPLDYLTNFILKRIFDIVFSLSFLLFIGVWLFPIIGILIWLDSRGPVFFIQKRYGYHEEVFGCIKFRTMYVNDGQDRHTTAYEDPRITRVGRFLRRSSLDELPQFLNVLIGDMSVVGPRPHMILVDDFYKLKIGRYAVRSLVRPGISGLAQVNGLRGDRGDMALQMQKRVLADAFYVKNWSPVLDMVIILKSVYLLLLGDKNAS